ncbi:hypothetical protein BY458DRAFT_507865 [Sporodiniella umbellata]|nr:hypothetical protein BY458DRAFT_507865 [Sporodiniella umbellata]
MQANRIPHSPPFGPNESKGETVIPSHSAAPKTPPIEEGKGFWWSKAKRVMPGEFEAKQHFYPRVLNASLHPLVGSFLALGQARIVARYHHLHPEVSVDSLEAILSYQAQYFQWAGSDLFHVMNTEGKRQMVVVETNSCPSGQKSMPFTSEEREESGYGAVMSASFVAKVMAKADPALGGLAVIYDKNAMECSGYASVLANLTGEPVWYVAWEGTEEVADVRWVEGVLWIRGQDGDWHSIRACFRYVTQSPWDRFPLHTRTVVMNEIVSCLAGGRNKTMAAHAYRDYNRTLSGTGLAIRMPDTLDHVSLQDIPALVQSMDGHAVIKVPYSNAGQGVYTITQPKELEHFMSLDHRYNQFLVQSLVGNAAWSSKTQAGKLFHVGTIPDKKNQTFVTDLRMMITAGPQGFQPVCLYGRKSRRPLKASLDTTDSTWDMLGTNLSIPLPQGGWTTDTSRLILMDTKDFCHLGLAIDDLIDAYIQTVLSVIAIDRMACRLMAQGSFDYHLFYQLNPDDALLKEIYQANPPLDLSTSLDSKTCT